MKLSKYIDIAKISLLNKLAYPWEVVAWVMFLLVIFFIYINLWNTVYAGKPSMNGFTLPAVVWFLLFTEVMYGSARNELLEGIGKDIKTGEIAYQFLRPVNYVVLKLCSTVGDLMFYVPSTLLFGGMLMFAFTGWFNPTPVHLLFSIIPFILGIILNVFLLTAMALLTFWMEEARSLRFIQTKVVLFLGGGIVPLDFFPAWFSRIVELTPFPAMSYLPAKTIVAFSWPLFFKTVGLETFWILVMGALIYLLYKTGSETVKVHGG